MNRMRKYVLPFAASATLVLGLAVAVSTPAVAKAAKVPTIKVSPKTGTEGKVVKITGKNWNYTLSQTDSIGIDECEAGATTENQCDTDVGAIVTNVTTKGSWSATLTLADPYEDADNPGGTFCGTTTANESACDIGAGNIDQTQPGAQMVSETYSIKPPKVKK
jgi:hypothetical protein